MEAKNLMSVFHGCPRRTGISEQSYAFSKENGGEERVGRVVEVAVVSGESVG